VELDTILHGGFPESRTTLIKGEAGTGKTLIGLQFLYHAAVNGDAVLFVSFEESAAAVRQNARTVGIDIQALEETGFFFLWQAAVDHILVKNGDFNIDALLAIIQGKARQLNARIIMIDALDVLLRVFNDREQREDQLYRLNTWTKDQQFTCILTTKVFSPPKPNQGFDIADYMADCVIFLDMRIRHQVATRRIRVLKYRGSGFIPNEHPYLITSQGISLLPITIIELATYPPPGPFVSSGISGLDAALGGGYRHGAAIVISGESGIGKTTFAATFAACCCDAAQKVLFVSFEEASPAIIESMMSPGIDLQAAADRGKLQFHIALPEALGPEEHLFALLQKITRFKPGHLIIDSISACRRMGGETAAFDFLARLIYSCKSQKITCLMTEQTVTESSSYAPNITTAISSICDTLISLDYIKTGHQIDREMTVIKSRGTHHSRKHENFQISDTGILFSRKPLQKEAGNEPS
jgi:circadian clock protein KaiC